MLNAVAIITARGGSKRIPKKNIRDFLGAPIIKYSIDAALHAQCFDEVMVSTDDAEIAAIGKNLGAKIPFMRSAAASDDFATTADVISEVINQYESTGKQFRYFCAIYPTAPFLTADKLKSAYQTLVDNNVDSVVPVASFSFPIYRSFKIENGLLKMNWPEYMYTRSQDLPKAFHDCGQFYFGKTSAFMKSKSFFPDSTIAIETPALEVQDIDSEEDWKIAEMKYLLSKKNL